MGVTDAVGEEEDKDSCGEAEPMAMSEAEELFSEAEMSLFTSSLLRRDTAENTKTSRHAHASQHV